MSQLRRRVFNKTDIYPESQHNIYKDIIMNKRLYNSYIADIPSSNSLYGKIFITANVPVIPGHKIKIHHGLFGVGDGATHACNLYKENGDYLDFWGRPSNSDPFTFTVNNGAATAIFCACLQNFKLDDFYVLDVTDNIYIYRGKNVI